MENCKVAMSALDRTLYQFLNDMIKVCTERKEYGDTGIPGVIIVDVRGTFTSLFGDSFIELVDRLTKECSVSNCYLILSVPFFDGIINMYPSFDTRLYADLPVDAVHYLIGREASALIYNRSGCVRVYKGDEYYVLYSPFYSKKRKRNIWRGKILPYGCSFDKDRLRDWAVFQNIIGIGD